MWGVVGCIIFAYIYIHGPAETSTYRYPYCQVDEIKSRKDEEDRLVSTLRKVKFHSNSTEKFINLVFSSVDCYEHTVCPGSSDPPE